MSVLCTREIFYDAAETGPSPSPYLTLTELDFLRSAVFAQAEVDFIEYGEPLLDENRRSMLEFGYTDDLHEDFSIALDCPERFDRALLERVLPVLCQFYFSIRENEIKQIEAALPEGMSFGDLVCVVEEVNASNIPASLHSEEAAMYSAFEDNIDAVGQLSDMLEMMEDILVRPATTNVVQLPLPKRTLRLGG